MAALTRLYYAWTLSCADGQDHAVADEEFLRAHREGSGLSEALCGHRVVPGPLAFPPGPRCQWCLRYLRARATMSDPDLRMRHRRRRRRVPLRRLFARCRRTR
ncbi:hypothetical protein GCM10025787_29730 [Saccharopolyspora rosea]|uniref:Uncharacterized protein n=1 Tax=Saccharopolyspora rosea TaxID=524884 RepID=A0ABW3G1T6_9PSEU